VLQALQQRAVDANVFRVAEEAAHAPVQQSLSQSPSALRAVAVRVAPVDAPAPRARAAQALLDDRGPDLARRVEGAAVDGLPALAVRVGWALEARARRVVREEARQAHAVVRAVRVRGRAAVQTARVREADTAEGVGGTRLARATVCASEGGVAAAAQPRVAAGGARGVGGARVARASARRAAVEVARHCSQRTAEAAFRSPRLATSVSHALLCAAVCARFCDKSHGWNKPSTHSEQLRSELPSAPATHWHILALLIASATSAKLCWAHSSQGQAFTRSADHVFTGHVSDEPLTG